MAEKGQRTPYDLWSSEEESFLLYFLDQHYNELYGSKKGANFKHDKDVRWRELVNSLAKIRGKHRAVDKIKDKIYNLQRQGAL